MDARVQAHERTPRVPLLLELLVVIDRETLVSPFLPFLELGVRCACGSFLLYPFPYRFSPTVTGATLDPSNRSGARAENG